MTSFIAIYVPATCMRMYCIIKQHLVAGHNGDHGVTALIQLIVAMSST